MADTLVQRVLVTGATGFLGGRLVARLLERGAQVTGQGRNPARLEDLSRTHAASGRFAPVRAELSVRAEVDRLIADSQPAFVVHCAAKSAPFGAPRDFIAANADATEHLAQAARGVRGFVHISTPSIYCAGRPLVDVKESAPLPRRSINAYAASKREAEMRLRAVMEQGLCAVILRPRAIFGPGDTALFPRLVKALGDGGLPVIGDGENVSDLTYVDNVCSAVELALEQLDRGHGAAIGNIYNVTNGESVQLWQVIGGLADRLGMPKPGSRFPKRLPRAIARPIAGVLESTHRRLRRRGEPRLTRYSVDALSLDATLDISAAQRDLGYVPEVSIDEGIERFIASLGSKESS